MDNEIKITNKDAKLFLVNWKQLIEESGLFPDYDLKDELLVRGLHAKVKSFLRAEYEDGQTWEALKDDLKMVIDGWGRVPSKSRTVSGVSSRGRLYNAVMPNCPNFSFYYNNYSSVRQRCRKYSRLNMPKVVPETNPVINHDDDDDVDFYL